MTSGKLLRRLVSSGAEGDLDAFRGVAKQVIAEEREKQHHLLANDLEDHSVRAYPYALRRRRFESWSRPSPKTESGASRWCRYVNRYAVSRRSCYPARTCRWSREILREHNPRGGVEGARIAPE